MGEIEYFFYCPYCDENISMLIDLNFSKQLYTEDCEVCCRPIEVDLTAVDGSIESWKASRSD
jgi:transcription elongation factor Elf1